MSTGTVRAGMRQRFMISGKLFRRILVVVFVCFLGWDSPAQAQRVQIERGRPAGIDSTLVSRFQLADTYLRGGQYDRAIVLLEDLYATSPTTHVFFDKLKEAYENVKRYDEAIVLIDERIAQTDNSTATVWVAEKARLTYLKGEEQAAFGLWDAAIPEGSQNENMYRLVYSSLLKVRLFDRAIQVLERGRSATGNPTAFQADLAYLYSVTGHHEQAMEEYLGLLSLNERRLTYVRNRLSRFLEQEGALEASIAVAERGVRKTPLNRSYREVLAWLYMEAEDFRKAYDTYRAIDRLEQENGRVLFDFAKRAADADAYEVALEAFDEVLERYPSAPVAAEAQMGLAEMHERWAQNDREHLFDERGNRLSAPHYEAALESYRGFLQQYPAHPYYPEVLRRIGRLQQDVFFNLGEADATLNEVTTRYPNSPAAHQAHYDLGRIALVRGNLEEARLIFSRLVEELRIGDLAERARYEQALIHFYRGEFDAAQTLVSVIDENTSTDVSNDAIELKMLLFENMGPDSLSMPLQAYAQASLLYRQRRTSEVIQVLDRLLQEQAFHPLGDETRFLRATALRDAGEAQEAFTAFFELPLAHPDSPLVDRSLYQAGEIKEFELNDPEGALEIYTRLLTDYPGSLLVPDVRIRIRSLRGDGA